MPSSHRLRRLRLTPEAEDDLREILQYTQETWGLRQRDTYRAMVKRTFRHLARFPGLGRLRDELSPNLRSYPLGQHLIFYEVVADGLIILRILHSGRDIKCEFETPSP